MSTNPDTTWIGFRNGKVVATYPNQWMADAALEAYKVDSVAPNVQRTARILNRPEITPDMVAQFVAFDHYTLYPVVITTDIKTDLGNVIAVKGALTWGAADWAGRVMVWTQHHYAGCKSASINHGFRIDFDAPVRIG